jgi:ABC-2 type transport system ATP-binding protein
MFIEVSALTKTFRLPNRAPGPKAAIKHFFKPHYREIEAIKSIEFGINKGELIGYLGPNGAGKSTTLKILTGILVPDSGHVQIGGIVPWEQRQLHASHIGVVFGQKSQLWWDLPLADSFTLLKAIYKIPEALYKTQYDWLITDMGIHHYLHQPVRQLSLGQRMRAELVASLLHLPDILFLDEPTIGLDAISKQTVRKFIQKLNRDYGTTVILTTHDMDDIEALCQRVMVIDQGKLAFDGTLGHLRARVHNMRRITVDANEPIDLTKLSLPRGVTCPQETLETAINSNQLILEFNPLELNPQEVITWLASHVTFRDLLIENPPIEEIIARLYGELL